MYKMFTSTRDKTEAVWNVHEVKPSESDSQRVGRQPLRQCFCAESLGLQAIVRFEAVYKFGDRPVTNQITADILVIDGKVKEQTDSFDMPTWAGTYFQPIQQTQTTQAAFISEGQALGLFGWMFGNFAFLQNSVNKRANSRLDAFMAKYPEL